MKKRLRNDTGLGPLLHSSNRAAEFLRDGVLLLGRDGLHDVLAGHALPPRLATALAGATGWDSLDQLAGVLELASPYALLRSYDWIESGEIPQVDSDLDVLAASRRGFVHAAGGRRHVRKKHWPHFMISVRGDELRIDVSEIGDGHLDSRWQEHLLRTAVTGPRGFVVPSPDEHFFSLAHHVLVDKPTIKRGHGRKLDELSAILGPDQLTDSSDAPAEEFEHSLASVLSSVMVARGYCVPEVREPWLQIEEERARKYLSPALSSRALSEPVRASRRSTSQLKQFALAIWQPTWVRARRKLMRVLASVLTLMSAYRAEGLQNVRPCWKQISFDTPGAGGETRRVVASALVRPSASYVRGWDGWERTIVRLSATPHVRYLSAQLRGTPDAGPYLFYKAMQYSTDEASVREHLNRFEDVAIRAKQNEGLESLPLPLVAVDGHRSPTLRIVDGVHRLAIALALFDDQPMRVYVVS